MGVAVLTARVADRLAQTPGQTDAGRLPGFLYWYARYRLNLTDTQRLEGSNNTLG